MSSITFFPAYDGISGSKFLQLMTGLSGELYWISNYLFDGLIYAITWAVVMCIYAQYNHIGTHAAGNTTNVLIRT